MNLRMFLPIVAVLFAACVLPGEVSAQFPRNTNQSRKFRSVISGGAANLITSNATTAFIGGGYGNTATNFATIVGGGANTASGEESFIGGGRLNKTDGEYATVGGGKQNEANADSSAVAGGFNNVTTKPYATAGGGRQNKADGECSVVGGGRKNEVSGDFGTIPGGEFNEAAERSFAVGSYAAATNIHSFAAGHRAKTTAAGQFVWADSQDADYTPAWANPANTFNVRAAGGVAFQAASGGAGGEVYWKPGDMAWTIKSDASTKENFRAVDAREVLKHITSLPITEWSYKGYSQRNIGPMADDWHHAFPSLSEDDKTINSGDVQGVSLVAIQGLVEELKERDKAIEELKSKLEAVEQRLDALPLAPGH